MAHSSKLDQLYMSKAEFLKSPVVKEIKAELKDNENWVLQTIRNDWSKQAATRLKNSAKRAKISPYQLLQRFVK